MNACCSYFFRTFKPFSKTPTRLRRSLQFGAGFIALLVCNPVFSQGPITIEGINFNMSKAHRLSTLQSLGYDCSLKQTRPYKGYWKCGAGKKTILMGRSEAYFSCHVLGNCALAIAEIAQTLRRTHQIETMTSSVFFRDVGRFNWYCGKDNRQADQVCVQKLVRVDHQMINMMLGESAEEDLDPITRFLLSFQRPYVHLKRLNGEEKGIPHRDDIMSAG